MNIPTNMKKNELFFFLNNESPFPNSELDDAAGKKKNSFRFAYDLPVAVYSSAIAKCKIREYFILFPFLNPL